MHRFACIRVALQQRSGLSVVSTRATAFHRAAHQHPTRSWRSQALHRGEPIAASLSFYTTIFVVTFGSALLVDQWLRAQPESDVTKPSPSSSPNDKELPVDRAMTVAEGHLGNLTPEQEQKLKEFWALTLVTFGVKDGDAARYGTNGIGPEPDSTAAVEQDSSQQEKKKKSRRITIFGRKHDNPESSPNKGGSADDDKYGQTAESQRILAKQSPELLRTTFWTMLKADHPDQLLLRFLRARKWDINKALAMLVSTLNWRVEEMQVDDSIILPGEEGALKDESSADATTKREGHDFLAQLRMGKSFLHGSDKEGRPLTYVRARLHRGGEQTEKALERFTVYVIETTRLTLRAPVETACIVFDMTGFTLANMDYTPVKFMIKVFEANYPESLGAILVHKAPWVFQGIWRVIRGWLDPVVASKVHFTNSVDDMSEFIPRTSIIKELGGEEDWEYQYVEPIEGENDLLKDTVKRDELLAARDQEILKYQQLTFDWIHGGPGKDTQSPPGSQRNKVANTLSENYWRLDPYVRARSLYDRVGMIQGGGKINFLPSHVVKSNAPSFATAKESFEDTS